MGGHFCREPSVPWPPLPRVCSWSLALPHHSGGAQRAAAVWVTPSTVSVLEIQTELTTCLLADWF